MSFEIEENNDIINTKKSIEIETNSVENIETNPTIEIKAEVEKWVITGDDIYIANQTTDLPIWYKSLIDGYITNESTIANDVSNLNDTFSNFETGYNQTIGTIENNLTTLTYDLTTNYVTNGTYNAGIQNLQLSKIDESGATTVAENVIGSWQNDPNGGGAWFDNKISTFSSTQESQATSISSLSTQYNGLVVSITEVDEIAQDAYGWSANSSKLITAGDNSITGWSFGDGSNIQSTFNIYADNFTISDGTNTTEPPFSVVAGSPNKVQFNGVVSFTNTDMTNYDNSNIDFDGNNDDFASYLGYTDYSGLIAAATAGDTIINGGFLRTSLIDTDTLIANHIEVNNVGTGFVLDDNAAGTSADPNISGAYIKGSIIEGSTTYVRDLKVLTDADYETKAIYGNYRVPEYGTSNSLKYTLNTGIYSYNATTTNGNYRLAKANDNLISGFNIYHLGNDNWPSYYQNKTIAFKIYRGSTLLYQKNTLINTLPTEGNTIFYEICNYNGLVVHFILRRFRDDGSYIVRDNAKIETVGSTMLCDLSGEGELKVEITGINFLDAYYYTPMTLTVSNI